MRLMKKIIGVTLSATLLLTGCNAADNNASNESISEETQNAETNVAWDQIDKTKWNYNSEDNGDGTYTCEMNTQATVGTYTAETAPLVIPVDTPGYSAMSAPTDYVSEVAEYTSQGFVYVKAGCRGRDAGAPAGVTDLKAAIRYIRHNEGNIPGNMERIFSFGMSGGGAQSALLGATGDSELYTPYLEAIGAVSGVSDAVAGYFFSL